MACYLGPGLLLLLLLLQLLLRSTSSAARNRCVDAAEACTADARCQQLRTEYVAQCLGGGAGGVCPRARCRRALRRFFARGPPALTHALLFCPCVDPVCAERRRQTFVPACAFSRPGQAPPSCLAPLDTCEHSGVCRPRLLAFQASCAPAPSAPDGCPQDQASRCLRAYAGLVGTKCGGPGTGGALPGFLHLGEPITALSGSPQAPQSPPTTWTTGARAWRPGATAEPAEIDERSAKPSGSSLPGTAAWMALYRPLTAGSPQSCRTIQTPARTLSTASCRYPPQMGP